MKNLVLSTLLYTLVILSLSDCTTDSNARNMAKLPPPLPALEEGKIYNYDEVYNYIFDSEELFTDSVKSDSKKVFLQGMDIYKNKKDATSSIALFKKSICIFPDAKSYNELGNALLDIGQYEQSLRAYNIAVKLGYSPLALTYFNMACADAVTADNNTYQYLVLALKNGFKDSLRFVTDERLNKVKQEQYYRELLLKYLANDSNKENAQFELFVESFPKLTIPYEITPDEVDKYDHDQAIGYDFRDYVEEMQNANFGRDVSNEFVTVGLLKRTDKYTAILYKSIEVYAPDVKPVQTLLVTYNNKGEEIAKKLFSCQCSIEKIKTGKFDGETITITEYERIWEKDFESVPMDENYVKENKVVSTDAYKFDTNGNIVDASGSNTKNASL